VLIRKAERGDIDSFVEVYAASYKGMEEYAYTKRREIRNYFKWLQSRDRDGLMVAVVDDKVVGFVACDTNWISVFERRRVGEIHELFVLPEFRGRGVGSELLKTALNYARDRKRDTAELWVGRTNYRARRFYTVHGFEEAGEWGKWVRMKRDL
jgi:ribosomal protein S18 acetylase RimI-like enzyme